MDIVYILGKGSLANDDELRYSLRSLESRCKDLGKIFIIGESLDWLQNVCVIPHEDKHKKPWKNALDKVRAMCEHSLLSDDFLLMNDDFFAFDDFLASEVPYYATKGGNGGVSGPVDFAVHKPIRINKEMYLKMPITTEMSTAYSPRSFYGNFYKAPPTFIKDKILRTGEGMPSLSDQLGHEVWASIDDITMTDIEFRVWIDTMYPDISFFEMHP